MNLDRRHLLAWGLTCSATTRLYAAPDRGGPIKLGVEEALTVSGLLPHLQRALGRDIGLALEVSSGPGLDLLDRLKTGALDAALTQVPAREEVLDREGLIHNRKLVTTSRYLLVGPASDPAGAKGAGGILQALDRIVTAGQANPAQVAYVAHAEPSGARETESALWKALGPRPIGSWMRLAPAAGPRAPIEVAAKLPGGGYALVESGVWDASRASLKVCVSDDPRLDAPYHVALPFASRHPAGKLLVFWLTQPTGQQAVRRFGHGYRPAKA